ncbi:MAG: cupin domain-containing protein [Betaproteobacteria bacterium]
MLVRHYRDVEPAVYDGGRAGVAMREMITAREGAPTFAMRIFDIEAGASTPYHQHAWEHEVFIVSGRGHVGSEQGDRPFAAGDTVFIPGHELHCFVAETTVQFVCVIPTPNVCQAG